MCALRGRLFNADKREGSTPKRAECNKFINIHTHGGRPVFIASKTHQGARGLLEYVAT